jgi:hypothetical protein
MHHRPACQSCSVNWSSLVCFCSLSVSPCFCSCAPPSSGLVIGSTSTSNHPGEVALGPFTVTHHSSLLRPTATFPPTIKSATDGRASSSESESDEGAFPPARPFVWLCVLEYCRLFTTATLAPEVRPLPQAMAAATGLRRGRSARYGMMRSSHWRAVSRASAAGWRSTIAGLFVFPGAPCCISCFFVGWCS